MKEKLSALATAVLVVCALTVTGLVVRRALFSPAPSLAQGRFVEGWESLLDEPAPPGGGAEVRMVVFTDYTCTYCRWLEHALDSLRAAHGERLSVGYRHYPRGGETAFQAALASECAAEQERGLPFHHALFAHQEALGGIPWDSLAALAEVPRPEALRACVEERRTADAVRRDLARGEALGILGTPAFVLDGRLYLGARSYAELERLVRDAGGRR